MSWGLMRRVGGAVPWRLLVGVSRVGIADQGVICFIGIGGEGVVWGGTVPLGLVGILCRGY